jgi:hypothetical protein
MKQQQHQTPAGGVHVGAHNMLLSSNIGRISMSGQFCNMGMNRESQGIKPVFACLQVPSKCVITTGLDVMSVIECLDTVCGAMLKQAYVQPVVLTADSCSCTCLHMGCLWRRFSRASQ